MLPRLRSAPRAFSILAISVFALWGCFSDKSVDPTSPDTVEELQLKGSISGTVTDSVKIGISGVAVTLDSGGFATNTDSLGHYTIPNVPGRTWTVRFTKAGWQDTSVAKIVLAIDEDKKGVDAVMRRKPDSTLTRNIHGAVQVNSPAIFDSLGTGHMQAVALNAKGDTIGKQLLSWNGVGNFSGTMDLAGKSGTLWALVFDTLVHATSKGSVHFDSGSAPITIAPFYQGNALPSIALSGSWTTSTALALHATATDPLGGSVVRYEWSLDGKTWRSGAKDTTITVSGASTASISASVRATDDDGNRVQATKTFASSPALLDTRDGQSYPVVTIGKQTWMARNLAYVTDSSWNYENSADSGTKYGRLYTWAAAMALPDSCNLDGCADLIKPVHQGACPAGWHVPTPAEWTYLTDTVQNADSAATRLRTTTGWNIPAVTLATFGGKDAFGFAALPGGLRDAGTFDNSGTYAWFRTASPSTSLSLMPYQPQVQSFPALTTFYGYSVRCVKD